MSVRLAPSILSADPTRLLEAVRLVEKAGAELIHVDIMDGHYVPNLTFGPGLVSALKKASPLPVDVHLMVDNPERIIPLFLQAGADWLSFHPEASAHIHRDLHLIKSAGRKAGLALNPATSPEILSEILSDLDFILVMCVNPGWGSQPFIPSCRDKIRRLKQRIASLGLNIPISVDGGVKADNVAALVSDGAEILVAGSAIFSDPDPRQAFLRLDRLARTEQKA
ncbi:MAG: ribulose-phosphate 3-epimerase [Candidatus Aminicenantes bacterium RBG_13_63_10]|nr:MAG: ribulose-phosphate 3-epimerase [Candidatus Aminicenantes bacterium RBG_13_63_10]